MQSRKLEILNKQGYKLNAYLELPPNGKPTHYAIFAHCFTCNSNLNAVRHISAALAVHGIGVIRFDFTGLGQSEGTFAESHFSANVGDLVAVAQYMKLHYASPALLVGHSLGGAAVIAAAARLPEVKAVATIGAPARVDHVKKHFRLEKNDRTGDLEWEVNIGGRPFMITKTFLEEIEKVDLHAILGHLHKAVLFLHAPGDNIVGIENAQSLYEGAVHPKSFVSLDDADHLLTQKEDSTYAANIIATWASRYIPIEPNKMLDTAGEQLVGHLNLEEHKFTTMMQTVHHALIADEPEDVGGENLGPSPYDYLSAALAACTTMTIRLYAERKGWELKEIFVYITYARRHEDDMKEGPGEPGHLETFSKKLRLIGNLDEAQKERLREIAAKCPVHQTLSLPVHVETTLIN
ncbi:bifunctional alpha/beta hydrolase/OsmC family protein [Mucilaginibacter sabulilitoris]|uniref:Bifunctional alpha/beta hydrolase/OsmC family protein n=1 Tax=Mucilaginibacter sabulilitoris TaxID=1173583 RepID=A0ABZ0TNY4_9SPHI|nr:bifunctional alpha/beta hydrolase/OsmC family protein [Mucilaginibacter sabulilitoris]WPU94783.1 bifunctional alpha/beta hydrolase/OsmC family protein [Mucilaginibacter sabulilitoris]